MNQSKTLFSVKGNTGRPETSIGSFDSHIGSLHVDIHASGLSGTLVKKIKDVVLWVIKRDLGGRVSELFIFSVSCYMIRFCGYGIYAAQMCPII